MKGVLLCGGTGSRLYPLTKVINKNVLPVGGKPMLLYPLEKMVQGGITEICIVAGANHMGALMDLLGDGSEYGCDLTYRVQAQPEGIAQGLYLAKNFVGDDSVCLILGDNVFDFDLGWVHTTPKDQAALVVKEVPNPERFGVVAFDEQDKPTKIVEKPKEFISNYAITGIYVFPSSVFSVIPHLGKSHRGEYEITDIAKGYMSASLLKVWKTDRYWGDAGTFETLKDANRWAYGFDS